MRIAYADPPYIGQARRHYQCEEIDHPALIARLVSEFPDGWALSLSSTTLKRILALCPEDVRVAAWVKPFAVWKPGVNPAYAWEPVIWRGGRKRTKDQETVRDWVAANITTETGTHGAKPRRFSFWLFDLLGLEPTDEFVDLFPGSDAVSLAWEEWRSPALFPLNATDRP